MKLTDTACKNAKPKEKPYRLNDGEGLYLEVIPAGGKYWRLKYRYGGKEKRLALGVYPKVGLKKARMKRYEARKQLADGIDPSELRKALKVAQVGLSKNQFEPIALEWYAKQAPAWAESHSKRVLSQLKRDLFPYLGKKSINQITAVELLAVLRRVEGRGAVETAHRVLQNCGQIFRYAIVTGRAERDLSADLKGALSRVKGGHFSALTEPQKVAELLRAIDAFEGTLPVKCALMLAPIVFVRPGELRHTQWAHIDLDTAQWRYTVTKTNVQHIVPLAIQAVAILRDLYPLTGHGRFVFPSARTPNGTRPMSDVALLAGLRRMGFTKDEITVHGFRAIARTLLDEVLNFPAHLIEHQLAHAVRDPNGRAYNRTAHLPQREKMMQAWADYLDSLKAGAQVIPLARVR